MLIWLSLIQFLGNCIVGYSCFLLWFLVVRSAKFFYYLLYVNWGTADILILLHLCVEIRGTVGICRLFVNLWELLALLLSSHIGYIETLIVFCLIVFTNFALCLFLNLFHCGCSQSSVYIRSKQISVVGVMMLPHSAPSENLSSASSQLEDGPLLSEQTTQPPDS